jgi:hypothetical protein
MRTSNGNETELTDAVLDGVTGGGLWDTIVQGLKDTFGGGDSASDPIGQCVGMGNTGAKPKPAPAPKQPAPKK